MSWLSVTLVLWVVPWYKTLLFKLWRQWGWVETKLDFQGKHENMFVKLWNHLSTVESTLVEIIWQTRKCQPMLHVLYNLIQWLTSHVSEVMLFKKKKRKLLKASHLAELTLEWDNEMREREQWWSSHVISLSWWCGAAQWGVLARIIKHCCHGLTPVNYINTRLVTSSWHKCRVFVSYILSVIRNFSS